MFALSLAISDARVFFHFAHLLPSLIHNSGHVTSFPAALSLVSVALAAKGFHNAGVVPNAAVDIAPRHSGTVFGLVNTLGSVGLRYRQKQQQQPNISNRIWVDMKIKFTNLWPA